LSYDNVVLVHHSATKGRGHVCLRKSAAS